MSNSISVFIYVRATHPCVHPSIHRLYCVHAQRASCAITTDELHHIPRHAATDRKMEVLPRTVQPKNSMIQWLSPYIRGKKREEAATHILLGSCRRRRSSSCSRSRSGSGSGNGNGSGSRSGRVVVAVVVVILSVVLVVAIVVVVVVVVVEEEQVAVAVVVVVVVAAVVAVV